MSKFLYELLNLSTRVLCMIKFSYQFQTLHDDSCNDDLESVATLLLLEESPYVHAYFQTIWNNS